MNENIKSYGAVVIAILILLAVVSIAIYGIFVVEPTAMRACEKRGMEYVGIEQNPIAKCVDITTGEMKYIDMNK